MIYTQGDSVKIKYGGDLSDRYNNPYRLSLDMTNNLFKKNPSANEKKEAVNIINKLKQSMHGHDGFYFAFSDPVYAQSNLQNILKTSGYKNLNLDQAIDKLYSGRTQSDINIIKKGVEESLSTKNLSKYKLADVLKDDNWRPLFFKGLQNGNGYSNKSQVENISLKEFKKRVSDRNYEFKPPKSQKKQNPIEIEPGKENVIGENDTLCVAKLFARNKHLEMGQSNEVSNTKAKREIDNSPELG